MMQSGSCPARTSDDWQERFLRLLPRIQRLASIAFRACHAELREELATEAVARCYCAYHRLVQLGREHHAHPSVLLRFAVKQVGIGLRLGSSRNLYDVTARYSCLRSGIQVNSLHGRSEDGDWRELALESRRTSPAETAALRVDFAAWLSTLSARDREIALLLSSGEPTFKVAERFQVSRGRISQLRREFERGWYKFHGLDEHGREIDLTAA